MSHRSVTGGSAILLLLLGLAVLPCVAETPRGYYARLELTYEGRRLTFGPFVGYYFKPRKADDLTQLSFRCYNERQFYTDQLPAGALLFEGEAALGSLAQVRPLPRGEGRITPVFFDEAPSEWLEGRPAPQEEFLHFHSAYDREGPVHAGFWLRHRPVRTFIYNMGGRVDETSPLYHVAEPGAPQRFPRIIEFDAGPRDD